MMTAIDSAPISVAIQANTVAFQSYSSGILTNGCGFLLDHAVQAVGYNNTSSTAADNYWVVRNSWGNTWGQAGFLYIGMGGGVNGYGVCGINMQPWSVTGTTPA